MEKEEIVKYWLARYKEDKVGTIAKLSQAMQHMAWLAEWRKIHGNEPRIKPITEKQNGEKVKIGEANIAVPWSQLDEFFRSGNEYGDIETVKFLLDRIQRLDITPLTEEEIHDLSEKENVKWSDGKHSLNPLQGFLYDFTARSSYALEPIDGEEAYGMFYPAMEYALGKGPTDLIIDAETEEDKRFNEREKAFCRYYTTRLIQLFLEERDDSEFYDFVNFDITSVTTPEQLEELDRKLSKIMKSPIMEEYLELEYGDAEMERNFYKSLKEEVEAEIRKDSDRIENAFKVFVALETGNLDELLEDPETAKWAEEVAVKEGPEELKEKPKAGKEEKKDQMDLLDIIRDAILNGDNEIGYVKRTKHWDYYGGSHTSPIGIMPRKLYDLGMEHQAGFIIDDEGDPEQGGGYSWSYRAEFFPYDKCEDSMQKRIDKRRKEVEKQKERAKSDTSGEFDAPGYIVVPIYFHSTAYGESHSTVPRYYVRVKMTKRELAESEILPSDFPWEKMKNRNISRADIANADKEEGINDTDLMPIKKKGFKEFLKSLFRIKGKEENRK